MDRPMFEVPGAILAYDTIGSGPLLVFIAGETSDPSVWRPISYILASSFTVCTYARRGFQDSLLTAPQDYTPAVRLARDADDAAALIGHLAPLTSNSTRAYVLGTSTGGIVALELLQRHPEAVRMLISHQAPIAHATGNADVAALLTATYAGVCSTFGSAGAAAAVRQFAEHAAPTVAIEAESMRGVMERPGNAKDVEYWLQHELTQYSALLPDYARLRDCNSQLTLIFGKDGAKAAASPFARITEAVGMRTGAQVRMVPGGHMAYFMTPQEFAEAIIKIFLPTPPHMWPMFVP